MTCFLYSFHGSMSNDLAVDLAVVQPVQWSVGRANCVAQDCFSFAEGRSCTDVLSRKQALKPRNSSLLCRMFRTLLKLIENSARFSGCGER